MTASSTYIYIYTENTLDIPNFNCNMIIIDSNKAIVKCKYYNNLCVMFVSISGFKYALMHVIHVSNIEKSHRKAVCSTFVKNKNNNNKDKLCNNVVSKIKIGIHLKVKKK